ncbi:hypothetical protein [Isoalcanivorax beigongshangi]|uniref:Uncharacterized protein n=1 Tax=Isoalcanivorax beigongshangi TaxID=3238810 RepID=A0ABV4AJW9_9GAMM
MAKVIRIEQAAPEQALEHLRRLTGLAFSSFPESLVNPAPPTAAITAEPQAPAPVTACVSKR